MLCVHGGAYTLHQVHQRCLGLALPISSKAIPSWVGACDNDQQGTGPDPEHS